MRFLILMGGVLFAAAFAVAYQAPTLAQALTVQQRAAIQKQNETPQVEQPQNLDQLLAPTVRRLVAEELAASRPVEKADAVPAASEATDPFAEVIDSARNGVRDLSANFRRSLDILPDLPEHADRAFILLTDLEGWPRMWEGILNLAVMLIGGWFVARALRRLLTRILTMPEQVPQYGTARLTLAMITLMRDLVLLAAFVGTGFVLSLVWFAQVDPMRIFLITYLGAFTIGLLGWSLSGVLFAPDRGAHRLIEINDAVARRLQAWLTLVFAAVGLVGFSVGMIRLLGMPPATFDILLQAAGLFITAVTLWLLSATAPASMSDEAGTSLIKGIFARYRRAWMFIGLGLFLILWVVSVLSGDGTRVAAVMVAFAAICLILYLSSLKPIRAPEPILTRQMAEAHIPVDPEFAAEMEETVGASEQPDVEMDVPDRQPPGTLFPSLDQVLCWLLGVAAVMAVLHVIGLDMVRAFNSPLGQQVSLVLLDIAVILLVAGICFALVERTINRFVRQEHERALAMASEQATDEDGLGGVITSRFGTLLPLIRGFILSVLVAVTIMVVLSSMGIDIGPLLAGAGVVGIAIGFGAQALVRDIISGIFFLIDDAFRVGEYVEFGEIRGQVEQISIRSMRLRHHRGAIHTVPFGELRSITNYNRDWAIYKQEFRLHYEVNTDQVRKIIKKVGLRLMEDPELGPKFIQPLKSQGVFKIEEGALILRTKFMCKPREQFIIRKAVFQEVKNALYQAGIELAQRRVQIDWPEWGKDEGTDTEDGKPGPQQQQVMGGGAAAAGLIATENKTKPVYPDEP